MLKVVAHKYLKPELLDKTDGLFSELVEKTRKEDGCISYDLFVDEEDTGHFVFIETWRDHAALGAHAQSEHFTRIVPALDAMARKEGVVAKMKQKL
ncbi:putative quinol monooxygenase [Bartonella sp. LJL80]